MIPTKSLLSSREKCVVNETLSGFSAQQIAKRLSVKPKTIYTYRMRAFSKLGVSSDAELFRWYACSLQAMHGETVPSSEIVNPNINNLLTPGLISSFPTREPLCP